MHARIRQNAIEMNAHRSKMTTLGRLLAALVFVTGCAAPVEHASNSLTFIHLNDTYRVGAVEDGEAGGFGRVVSVIRRLGAEGRDVRILHAGDFLYPSLESQLWNGEQIVDAFNFLDGLAPMFVVAGNHEFDRRTPEHLVNAVRASRFDWLGDNYSFATGAADVDTALQSGFTFEHHGRTIGIFALTLHGADGGNSRTYAPTDRDYLAVADRTIAALEDRGADLIFGVTHLHLATDVDIAALKARHPRFLFVVGGHEHEPQYLPATGSTAAIMKGASNARVIWQIDVAFSADGEPQIRETRIPLDASVAEDPDYALLEQKWRDRLLEIFPFLTARVGKAAFRMDATEATIRNEETSWGNFIVDQMRVAFGTPPADLAFINSGTLRLDDFVAGDILFEDIGRTFGFSSFLRFMSLSGAEFRRVMEAGYRGSPTSKGYFPHVSGFRICVDRSQPNGSRVVGLQVPGGEGWRDIDPERLYTVVVPDYLYRGGDGYRLPQDRPASRPASELKYLVLDAIIRAQAEGRAVGEPVTDANRRYFETGPARSRCFE